MRSRLTGALGFLFGLILLAAPPASAQTELGVDLGILYDLGDPSELTITIPNLEVRAGFYANDRVEIEPRLLLLYTNPEVGDANTILSPTVGILYHLNTDRSKARWYIRPFGGLTLFSGGGDSETQFNIGGGLGVKIPAGERIAWRVEAGYRHAFETDLIAGSDIIGLLFGVSYYTR